MWVYTKYYIGPISIDAVWNPWRNVMRKTNEAAIMIIFNKKKKTVEPGAPHPKTDSFFPPQLMLFSHVCSLCEQHIGCSPVAFLDILFWIICLLEFLFFTNISIIFGIIYLCSTTCTHTHLYITWQIAGIIIRFFPFFFFPFWLRVVYYKRHE